MRIAFWGEETGSGTTSNMLVISEVFAWKAKQRAHRSNNSIQVEQMPEFIDCGSRTDEETRQLLREADLVIVNARQSKHMLDRFFLDLPGVSQNSFFLIGSYFHGDIYNRVNIERIYRIPQERIGVIPYNSEFRYACEAGKQREFMRVERRKIYKEFRGSGQTREFFKEVRRTVGALQKILIQIEEGEKNYGNCI